MKKSLGKKLIILFPFVLVLYIFVDDFIFKLPSYVFNLVILYLAIAILMFTSKEKE